MLLSRLYALSNCISLPSYCYGLLRDAEQLASNKRKKTALAFKPCRAAHLKNAAWLAVVASKVL